MAVGRQGRNREASWGTVTIIQERDDGGFDLCDISRCDENGQILDIFKPNRFSCGLGSDIQEKRSNGTRCFGLRN